MSADGRRRARVQGGWASSACSSRKLPNNKNSSYKPVDVTDRQTNRQILNSARSDKDRPQTPKQPIWTAKNVDSPRPPQRYVFQEPEEALKTKPDEKVITKQGVYDLSLEPSGISRIRFFPNFISSVRSEAIFAELFHEIPWKQRYDVLRGGVQALQPRLTAWYSDQAYYYAGTTDQPNTSEWPTTLKTLQDELEEMTGIRFNSFATNLYRDGKDSIGWHSDDEVIFGKNPVIASLSFGDDRMFELRKKPEPNADGEQDYTYSQVVKVPLHSGALLVMEGCTQNDWQHRVPKEYHDRGARINVTFRVSKDPATQH